MKPYFDDGLVQLYLGNSLELAGDIRADLIVTDLPYMMRRFL
jgi:hypothetical protein